MTDHDEPDDAEQLPLDVGTQRERRSSLAAAGADLSESAEQRHVGHDDRVEALEARVAELERLVDELRGANEPS